ncbi:MAG: twin-arginine translocation signal domain-containing protein [Corynebacterium sp.]|nr:twin-arginine translocation signal domain-containing protein [Corynebacterium sp.]
MFSQFSRRSFLAATGTVVAGAALASCSSPAPIQGTQIAGEALVPTGPVLDLRESSLTVSGVSEPLAVILTARWVDAHGLYTTDSVLPPLVREAESGEVVSLDTSTANEAAFTMIADGTLDLAYPLQRPKVSLLSSSEPPHVLSVIATAVLDSDPDHYVEVQSQEVLLEADGSTELGWLTSS